VNDRVIWAAPYVPWPLRSGGRLRSAHLARELAKQHRVAIVATISSDDRGADLAEARERLGAFADPVLFVPPRPAMPWDRAFLGPEAVRSGSRPSLRDAVHDLARALSPCAIVAEHSYTFAACDGAGAPVILDEHNRESDLLATLENGPLRARATRARYRAYEAHALRAARGVLACHEAEAAGAREVGARDVYVIPNGVDEAAFPFTAPSSRAPDRVLFTGTFAHRPNAEAARWLALEVWPHVVRQRPNARLVLVGHAPPEELRALASASIEVVASAPDIAPYFAGATVYAAAVRAGAGTNLKTLEAAAAGLALVATTKALDAPDAFAEALVRCLRDPPACDERAASARAIVEARCTWSRVGEAMRAAFTEMLGAVA
jgi:glycosyltransferase involved in cell wall biosynthesis